jgi:hypothetical protein
MASETPAPATRATANRLNRVANLAVVLSAVLTAGVYARAWLGASPVPAAAPAVGVGYVAGDVLPPLEGVSYAAADRSLILFVSSSCHFCTESMPFYDTLVRTRNARKANVALIALSREAPADLQAYLGAHGVALDRALSTAGRTDLKFFGTPTLVLLNRAGAVQQVWVGALRPDAERQVLRVVTD